MSLVTTDYHGEIAILRLTNGVTNAINPDLVSELSASLAAVKDKSRGMLLCGGSKFFCIGLDLPLLLTLDRPTMSQFWEKFNRLCLDLFTAPLPTACVLAGHAIAGGAILALTGDYRLATAEKKQIGLNELKLGVPVPYLADMILRHTIADSRATHIMFGGHFMPFAEAAGIGLIDEIGSPDMLETLALEKIADIADSHNQAFRAIKATKVEVIKERYEKHSRSRNEWFIDSWFSDPAQALLREASRKF